MWVPGSLDEVRNDTADLLARQQGYSLHKKGDRLRTIAFYNVDTKRPNKLIGWEMKHIRKFS